MRIRYEPEFFLGGPYWIVDEGVVLVAYEDKKPRRSTFADWRMALRRKLNGDTR